MTEIVNEKAAIVWLSAFHGRNWPTVSAVIGVASIAFIPDDDGDGELVDVFHLVLNEGAEFFGFVTSGANALLQVRRLRHG
jgi:hypothetical protein